MPVIAALTCVCTRPALTNFVRHLRLLPVFLVPSTNVHMIEKDPHSAGKKKQHTKGGFMTLLQVSSKFNMI